MACKSHKCFQPPVDKNIKIWRYMDFTKYVSFLDSKSLFFSRSDRFNDPYEGATSYVNAKLRPEIYKEHIPQHDLDKISKIFEWVRYWTFVNCWHMNKHESAAMWKLYAQTNEAVAIQSTYQRLHDCLPGNIYIGVVNYMDYENDLLPEDNTMWPFVHKRKSFEHERELRALIQDLPNNDKGINVGLPNPELGRLVLVSPVKLIENIYVAPGAPGWFVELVKKTAAKFDYNFEVKQSVLSKSPVY